MTDDVQNKFSGLEELKLRVVREASDEPRGQGLGQRLLGAIGMASASFRAPEWADGSRWALETDPEAQRLAKSVDEDAKLWSLFDARGERLAMLSALENRVVLMPALPDGGDDLLRVASRVCEWLSARERALAAESPRRQVALELVGEAWEPAGIRRVETLGGRFLSPGSLLTQEDTDQLRSVLLEDAQAVAAAGLRGWEPSEREAMWDARAQMRRRHEEAIEALRAKNGSDRDFREEKASQDKEAAALKEALVQRMEPAVWQEDVDATLLAFVRSSAAWSGAAQAADDLRLATRWADASRLFSHKSAPSDLIASFLGASLSEAAAQDAKKAQDIAQDLFDRPDWIRDRAPHGRPGDSDAENALMAIKASRALVLGGADGAVAKRLFEEAARWSEATAAAKSHIFMRDDRGRGLESLCPWTQAIAFGHADWALERLAAGGKSLGLAAALEAVRQGEPVATVSALAQPWLEKDGEKQVSHYSHRHFTRETLKACAEASIAGQAIEPYAHWLLFDAKALSEKLQKNESLGDALFECAKKQAPEILDDIALSFYLRRGLWPNQAQEFERMEQKRREERQALSQETPSLQGWRARQQPEAAAGATATPKAPGAPA
jgi:hypothetical protein